MRNKEKRKILKKLSGSKFPLYFKVNEEEKETFWFLYVNGFIDCPSIPRDGEYYIINRITEKGHVEMNPKTNWNRIGVITAVTALTVSVIVFFLSWE